MAEEIWKDIEEVDGIYQVSNQARVKRKSRELMIVNGSKYKFKRVFPEIILKQHLQKGHWHVELNRNGERLNRSVAVLVANAFLPKDQWKTDIIFIDGNKLNAIAENLKWATWNEKNGTLNDDKGGHNKRAVIQVDENGSTVAIYESLKQAAKAIGVTPASIMNVCKNKRPQLRGYGWKYANP